MKRTIQQHDWSRVPTIPTAEERYDAPPLPPLPDYGASKRLLPPLFCEGHRVPWLQMVLVAAAVDLLLRLVAHGCR